MAQKLIEGTAHDERAHGTWVLNADTAFANQTGAAFFGGDGFRILSTRTGGIDAFAQNREQSLILRILR